MAGISRRSFFGGLMGVMAALVAGKAAATQAAPAVPEPMPVAPLVPLHYDPCGMRTTYVYDCCGRLSTVSVGERSVIVYPLTPLTEDGKQVAKGVNEDKRQEGK